MITGKTKAVATFSLFYLMGAFVGLFFFVYNLISSGITLEEQARVIANQNALKQQYNELLALLKETEAQRTELITYFLTKDSAYVFLDQIGNIARRNGVTLTTDTLQDVASDGHFGTVVANFSIVGNEEGVIRMIEILESLPYHGQITKLQLITNSKDGFSAKIELMVSLISYD